MKRQRSSHNATFITGLIITIILMAEMGTCLWGEILNEREMQDCKYVVVVSAATNSDAGWKQSVSILQEKYHANVVQWVKEPKECLGKLQDLFPDYVCFVATPTEAGRDFVTEIHQMMRELDEDPYTDAIWAILTGYNSDDARRIASHREALEAKRILTATVGAPMDGYETGKMYNELKSNELWEKRADGTIEKINCPTDITELIAEDMNTYQADVWITSGHATEKDWNPGYGYRCGRYLCDQGTLYGQDLKGEKHPINSSGPRVLLAIGNCLLGHISDENCIALAFMHSAGVYQLLGYTVTTWYGYGGWGVKDYFSELQAGRFTLAQANYVNNLALVYELEKSGGKERGLVYDRDVVVLYGDPAWAVKMTPRQLPWRQELTEKDGIYTFKIIGQEKGDWDNRPVIELLPHRIKNIDLLKGGSYHPVITDNFILVPVHKGLEPMKGNKGETLPIRGDYTIGDTIEIQFKADRI